MVEVIDLVDSSALFQSALCHYFGSHLLHIQHESIQGLFDMRFLVLFFLRWNGWFPANPKHLKTLLTNCDRFRRNLENWILENYSTQWWTLCCGANVARRYFNWAYACIDGLMLSPLGSCLMAGETMAGWGMPVWWRLCGGGVTMWGEKRLETKLRATFNSTF